MNRTWKTFRIIVAVVVGLLVSPVFHAGAVVITANCPDPSTTLPAPKQLQSNCAGLSNLTSFVVSPNRSVDGGYNFGFTLAVSQNAFSLGKMDANGMFLWSIATTNGQLLASSTQQDLMRAKQNRPVGSN